jgi:aminopeptidase YwaD
VSESLLTEKAHEYLQQLCYGFPTRRTGSAGNRAATNYIAGIFDSFGFIVEEPRFDCIDWSHGDARVTVAGQTFDVRVSPYALGCDIEAELVVVRTVDELATTGISGKALLLIGDIASEQLMPKGFVFYNPEHHQRIIALLEERQPAVVLSATTRDPELAGGVYPFSLIEDGDFDIPSLYMTAEEGERLAENAGRVVKVYSEAERVPATGCNVFARKQIGSAQKITVFAHIDAKDGTPGALDNGTGVVVLLLLAELLQDYAEEVEIELVALNGEDYYSAPGEMQYWNDYADDFQRILLGINIDAAGFVDGPTAYTTYGCDGEMDGAIQYALQAHPQIVKGEPWYQSDHGLFIQRGRPALAITSDRFKELTTNITHTEKDTPELVDLERVVDIALGVRDVILRLVHLKV